MLVFMFAVALCSAFLFINGFNILMFFPAFVYIFYFFLPFAPLLSFLFFVNNCKYAYIYIVTSLSETRGEGLYNKARNFSVPHINTPFFGVWVYFDLPIYCAAVTVSRHQRELALALRARHLEIQVLVKTEAADQPYRSAYLDCCATYQHCCAAYLYCWAAYLDCCATYLECCATCLERCATCLECCAAYLYCWATYLECCATYLEAVPLAWNAVPRAWNALPLA